MQSKPDGSYGLQAETASKPFTCSPLPPVCGSGSSLPYSGGMWTSNPDEPRCASSAPNRPPRAVPSSPRPRTVRAAPSCSHGTLSRRSRSIELPRTPNERLKAGTLWQDNGLVFCTHGGRPLDSHNVARTSFKPLLKRAELPDIRFHDLRHTCATLLLTRPPPQTRPG